MYSQIKVDTTAGTITRRYGLRPFLVTKQYVLEEAKWIEIDVGRGIYTIDLVFQDGNRLVISPGDSELGVEKVLELVEITHIPINPTWLKKVQAQGKVLNLAGAIPPLPDRQS